MFLVYFPNFYHSLIQISLIYFLDGSLKLFSPNYYYVFYILLMSALSTMNTHIHHISNTLVSSPFCIFY